MTTTATKRLPGGANGANGVAGRRAGGSASARRRLLGRLSGGHLVMVGAGVTGMVLTLALLRGADDRVRVAVAARDLPAASAITPADVRYAAVNVPDALLGTLFGRGELDFAAGPLATSRIDSGALITRSSVRPRAARGGRRAMSIPIDSARAVNGELEPGDRVDVVVATASEVAIVVADAEVLGVRGGDRGGAFGGVDDQFGVTLAVDARESQLLTAATVDGDLIITRTTGSEPAEGTPAIPIDRAGGPR